MKDARRRHLRTNHQLGHVNTFHSLLTCHLAILTLRQVITMTIKSSFTPNVSGHLNHNKQNLSHVSQGRRHHNSTLFLRCLRGLLNHATQALIGHRHRMLFITLKHRTNTHGSTVNNKRGLTTILHLTQLLAGPRLKTTLSAPYLRVLSDTHTLSLRLKLSGHDLGLILLMNIATVLSHRLLTTLGFTTVPFTLFCTLTIRLGQRLFTTVTLRRTIVSNRRITYIMNVNRLLIISRVLRHETRTRHNLLPIRFRIRTTISMTRSNDSGRRRHATRNGRHVKRAKQSTQQTPITSTHTTITGPTTVIRMRHTKLATTATLATKRLPRITTHHQAHAQAPIWIKSILTRIPSPVGATDQDGESPTDLPSFNASLFYDF